MRTYSRSVSSRVTYLLQQFPSFFPAFPCVRCILTTPESKTVGFLESFDLMLTHSSMKAVSMPVPSFAEHSKYRISGCRASHCFTSLSLTRRSLARSHLFPMRMMGKAGSWILEWSRKLSIQESRWENDSGLVTYHWSWNSD